MRAADTVGVGIGRGEQLSSNRTLDSSSNVLEHIALSKDVATSANLERVTGVIEPVVVDLAYVLVRFPTRIFGVIPRGFVVSKLKRRFFGCFTHSVQKGVALNLGRTSTGVVDVVTLHGDEIAGSIKVDTPVVVSVAGSGVVAGAVDETVGDSDALGGLCAEHDVLTRDTGGGDVVDPDHVGVVDGDGIAAPDVLGVQVGDSDVPGGWMG